MQSTKDPRALAWQMHCMVTARAVVEGSVDQALKGKHYWWGKGCIPLWRETLIHKQLRGILAHELLSEVIKENLEDL